MVSDQPIRFSDGAGYERAMGIWSRLAGNVFLDWLQPPARGRWVDVGCGNGAFTELIVEHCAPSAIAGLDPSEDQLSYARERHTAALAEFQQGDAMALPYAAASFDAAVMALVIFFVPEPAAGVAEMVRVTRPGGLVAAYAWDILGGGFPIDSLHASMRAIGITPTVAPRSEVARLDALHTLWTAAGLVDVETREIVVQRPFKDFEDFWATAIQTPTVAGHLAAMSAQDRDRLKAGTEAALPRDSSGRPVFRARANAVKGIVPGK